jgi:V/A-type H+-transporting ATPase subunit E
MCALKDGERMKTGSEKVKEICAVLRRETLEPAQEKADEILLEAKNQAKAMIEEAKEEIEKLRAEANQEMQRQKNIFQSSLHQAVKQTLESLRQDIEEKLMYRQLSGLIQAKMQDPAVITHLIEAVIRALDKEGVEANLSVYVPAAVPARAINEELAKQTVERLKEKSVLIGPMTGGIEVKLHDQNVTIDATDAALTALVAHYIRKDFREMFFGDAI